MRDSRGLKAGAWPAWSVGGGLAAFLMKVIDGNGNGSEARWEPGCEPGPVIEGAVTRRLNAPEQIEDRRNGHAPRRNGKNGFSILKGVDELIDARLGLAFGEPPHYRHKESCEQLSARQIANLDGGALFSDLYNLVDANGLAKLDHSAEPPSDRNWRWNQVTEISERSASGEPGLHRRTDEIFGRLVAMLSCLPDARLRDRWANQVPIASGLTGSREPKRYLDLIHDCGDGAYDFIQLRTASGDDDNPLRAAIDILIDGMIYVFSRVHRDRLGYDPSAKKVLGDNARLINLRVIAPEQFYKHRRAVGLESFYRLGWFEGAINSGLAHFFKGFGAASDIAMGFRFESIRDNFMEPIGDHGFRINFVPQPVHSIYPKLGLFNVNVPSVPRAGRQ